jgi:hypothetical protein
MWPVEWSYDPVTLTIHVQEADVCTTSVCAPRLDCAVTDCPDDPVWLIAGVPEGADPAGVTNTWNDGPAAGAGAQSKAQPIFQGAAVVVNVVLVQLPFCCGESRRTCAGPAAAADGVDDVVGVVVDPPAAVVVVDPPAVVVVVTALPPAAVVVVAVLPPALEPDEAALGGGSVPLVVLAPFVLDAPPVSPLIHIPKTAAAKTAVKSCQVFQDRRSLMLSSPGTGVSSEGARTPPEGDVTDPASTAGSAWSNEPASNTPLNSRAHGSGRDPV